MVYQAAPGGGSIQQHATCQSSDILRETLYYHITTRLESQRFSITDTLASLVMALESPLESFCWAEPEQSLGDTRH